MNSSEFSIKEFISQCIGKIWPIGVYGFLVFLITRHLSLWASIAVSTIVYLSGFTVLLFFVCMSKSERSVAKQLANKVLRRNNSI